MRLATWNVNSLKARLPRVLDWVDTREPDVLCLQETKLAADAFPTAALEERGYTCVHHGQGRWNGVAVCSRVGLDDVERGFPGQPEFDGVAEARAVAATCGGVRVWSVYVPNGRAVDDPHYAYKLAWLEALRAHVADSGTEAAAVVGDFNVAPEDTDVWDPSLFVGSTHVTGPERAAVAGFLEAGLVDVVRARHGAQEHPALHTYWDYRAGAFHKKMGMRIDLVLAGAPVAARAVQVFVDREARKGSGPSDHAPVVVDLDTPGVPVAGVLPPGAAAGG